MSFLLSNPWVIGIASSVIGGLFLMLISNYGLILSRRRRKSDPEADRTKGSGKSKAIVALATIGFVAAWPFYYFGIWLWDSVVGNRTLEQLEAGIVLEDCESCPIVMTVPVGSFSMGSDIGEVGRYENEGPIHPVSIPETFGVGVYEVTRGEFRKFVNDSGHETGDSCWTYEGRRWRERVARSWRFPGFAQTEKHPVVCVNWDDARRYVDWLSSKTGQQYRLPTESEWEYAARAGTKTMYYWGDGMENGLMQCRYANGADLRTDLPWRASCDDGHEYTAPVGSYLPNAFGLHDMLGNVWEWTQDCWSDDYTDAPVDGSAYKVGKCGLRVLRGGSRYVSAEGIRTAHRLRFDPSSRNQNTGFRVARWAKPVLQSTSETFVDASSINSRERERNNLSGNARQPSIAMTSIEFNCETLTTDIEDIPTKEIRDTTIREIVSILIKELPTKDRESQQSKLQCAGRIAKMPLSNDRRDAELTRVIDANIRANRCSAARELTDHLGSRSKKSDQKAKVALECLGQQ